jgi:hypothetical protein
MPTGTSSGQGGLPPPTRPRGVRLGSFGRADFIGLGVFALGLVVLDASFMAVGRHSHNAGLFVLWICLQAIACIGAGLFQAVRGRNWQEITVVGAIAAVLLAFIVLVMVNPSPGSPDCGSQGPCDTSFGLGAVVISVLTFPLFGAAAALGRALSGLRRRRDRTD